MQCEAPTSDFCWNTSWIVPRIVQIRSSPYPNPNPNPNLFGPRNVNLSTNCKKWSRGAYRAVRNGTGRWRSPETGYVSGRLWLILWGRENAGVAGFSPGDWRCVGNEDSRGLRERGGRSSPEVWATVVRRRWEATKGRATGGEGRTVEETKNFGLQILKNRSRLSGED